MPAPIYHGATNDDAKVICIVIHGRGQTQQDMMQMIVERLDVAGVRYALPKSDDVGWYAARAVDPRSADTAAALALGLDQINEIIATQKTLSPQRPVLLCGFSQGACMAAELLLAHPLQVDAACLLTACRVGCDTDDLPRQPLHGLPVYASCGDADPWIPQRSYHALLGDLTAAGARLRTDMFPGRPHEVTDTEIGVIADMLGAMIGQRPQFAGAAI